MIEAKWNEFPDASDMRGVRELLRQLATKAPRELSTPSGWIICRTPDRFPLATSPVRIEAANLSDYIDQLTRKLRADEADHSVLS